MVGAGPTRLATSMHIHTWPSQQQKPAGHSLFMCLCSAHVIYVQEQGLPHPFKQIRPPTPQTRSMLGLGHAFTLVGTTSCMYGNFPPLKFMIELSPCHSCEIAKLSHVPVAPGPTLQM